MSKARDAREKMVAESAARGFANHKIVTLLEQGVYRHYRCGVPGDSNLHFHVVTFPGRILVCGDIGDMVWERVPDMLRWAPSAINDVSYFCEKTWRTLKTREWSEDVTKESIEWEYKNRLGDLDDPDDPEQDKEIKEKLIEVRDELLAAAESGKHDFYEAYCGSNWYDGDFPGTDDYTPDFLWAREALKWFFKNKPIPPVPVGSPEDTHD